MKTLTAVLVCIVGLTGCLDNPTSVTQGEVPVFNPCDAYLEGGTLKVLYGDRGKVGPGFIGVFARVDGKWDLKEQIYADTPDGLRHAHSVNPTPLGYLISDSANSQILEIDSYDGSVIWNSANRGIVTFYPNDAELAEDGQHILICDNTKDAWRVIEVVTASGEIVWEHPIDEEIHDCDYLENGNIRFVRSMSRRVEEVSRNHETVWKHQVDDAWPRSSDLMENGNTLIAGNNTIYEVTPGHDEGILINLTDIYNVRMTDEGILVACWEEVVMVSDSGSILWTLRLPRDENLSEGPTINPDRLRLGMPIHEYHNLHTLGYIN